jgi:hypothetical protein
VTNTIVGVPSDLESDRARRSSERKEVQVAVLCNNMYEQAVSD